MKMASQSGSISSCICEVCNKHAAKYKCPRCEVKTCCLTCVNLHKKELQCDGSANKCAYKPVSKFTNLDLLSDYRLLEDVGHSLDTYARDPAKYLTRIGKQLPVHLYKLRAAATRRRIRLQYLPQNFTRHKQNTTYLDWKNQIMYWRVEWVFPQAEGVKYVDKRLSEDELISKLLSKYIDPVVCEPSLKDVLPFYHAAGHSGVTLLLKAESVEKSSTRFFRLDPYLKLKDCLAGKAIIEFPTIHVVLKDHVDMYEILTSDDEEEEEQQTDVYQKSSAISSGSFTNKGARPRGGNTQKNTSHRKSNTKNLLFSAECPDSDSDKEISNIDKDSDGEEKDVKRRKPNYKELNIPTYEALVNKMPT